MILMVKQSQRSLPLELNFPHMSLGNVLRMHIRRFTYQNLDLYHCHTRLNYHPQTTPDSVHRQMFPHTYIHTTCF